MKKINIVYIVSTLLLAGCSIRNDTGAAPSQNPALNAVSPSAKTPKEKGFLQRNYDAWEQEDWVPSTEAKTSENGEISEDLHPVQQTTDETPSAVAQPQPQPDETATEDATASDDFNASETFKMQYYVDKWGRYLDKKKQEEANQSAPSNVEKLDAMPAIGQPGN